MFFSSASLTKNINGFYVQISFLSNKIKISFLEALFNLTIIILYKVIVVGNATPVDNFF